MAQISSNDGGVADDLHHDALTTTNVNAENEWAQFFGPQNLDVNPPQYDKYKYSTYDLPEAYKGRNFFIRDTLEGLILANNSEHTFYTSPAVLPYVQTDQIHFTWNTWVFNRTLAGQVPHQGISRLITSSKKSFKDHTVRHGLAFYLEHGFMKTPEGRQQYQRNLLGIQQSVQETNNYDVMAALLNCNRYDKEYQLKHGEFNKPTSEVMRREVDTFASVQKSGYGLDWVVEEYKEHMQRVAQVSPSTMIIPPRLAMYMTMADPVKTQYMYAGEGGVQMVKQGPNALTSFRGVNVFKASAFDVYEGELPIDLLSREVQIGEYYCMKDSSINLGNNYSSAQRDIVIYDESIDGWKRISFASAIENCTRFNEDGSLRDLPDGVDDLFAKRDGSGNAEYFIDIRHDYLHDNEFLKMGETLMSRVSLSDDEKKILQQGMALVHKYNRQGVPDFTEQQKANLLTKKNFIETTINGKKILRPTYLPIPNNRAGCGNWVMLNILANKANPDVEEQQLLEQFILVVKLLYEQCKSIFPDNAFIKPDYGNKHLLAFLKKPEEQKLCTFFENCIGEHYTTFWLYTDDYLYQNDFNYANAHDQFKEDVLQTILSNQQKKSMKQTLKDVLVTNETTEVIHRTLHALQQISDHKASEEASDDLKQIKETVKKVQQKQPLTKEEAKQLKSEIDALLPQFTKHRIAHAANEFDDYHKIPAITPYFITEAAGLLLEDHTPLLYSQESYTEPGTTERFQSDPALIRSKAPHKLQNMGIIQNHMRSIGAHPQQMFSKRNRDERNRDVDDSDEEDWSRKRQKNKDKQSIKTFSSRMRDGMTSLFGMDDDDGDYEGVGARAGRRVPEIFQRITEDHTRNYNRLHNVFVNDYVKRALGRCFLFSRVHRDSLLGLVRENIHLPFAILLARPYMTYSMSSAILMKGGQETGATYVGHSDFQLADDVASKVHYGNYTYYSKAIVHEPKNVIILENVICNRYLYGDGCKFWTNEELETMHEINADTVGAKAKGLISMIVPNSDSIVAQNPISLTGSFARDATPSTYKHYVGAEFYKTLFNFKDSTDLDDNQLVKYNVEDSENNTVCFQGHQFSYSQQTKDFTFVTTNTGHFGASVYPGCGRIRNGAGSVFKECDYKCNPC